MPGVTVKQQKKQVTYVQVLIQLQLQKTQGAQTQRVLHWLPEGVINYKLIPQQMMQVVVGFAMAQ
jgi:hypothetical protein